MKLIAVVCLVVCLQSTISLHAQTVTLSAKRASLEAVMKDIRRQTGYNYFLDTGLLKKAHKVTISLKDTPLITALDSLFADQPLDYAIVGQSITITNKENTRVVNTIPESKLAINGKVATTDGSSLPGASVRIRGTQRGVNTDAAGEFILKDVEVNDILEVSFIGYVSQSVMIIHQKQLAVCLKPESRSLDEVIATGYRTTTKKLMLATVTRISAGEIERQPVNNVLAALQGRVPGMMITQTSGVPGSGFVVQIRGQRSIGASPGKLPNNSPLFIIDGVPFLSSSETLAQLPGGYLPPSTPFSTINPSDIESIEILRDANSTSIYGSMGANGVVLITTRKPVPGKTTVDVNMYMGEGRLTRLPDYMNTKQYIGMRKEALRNDNVTGQGTDPSLPGYAPDIEVWDTTRYTNWKKLLVGGAAHVANANLRLSGGSTRTQFAFSVGYNRETTVFPGDFHKSLLSLLLNVTHSSSNNKFKITISSGYSSDKNNLPSRDLTSLINTAPNSPSVYDSLGKLTFREKGIPFLNPFQFTIQPYNLLMERVSGSIDASYAILPSLHFKTTAGYTIVSSDESLMVPIASQDPVNSQTGAASFGNSKNRIWIAEPQLEFATLRPGNKNQVKALLGTSMREQTAKSNLVKALGYVNDASLGSLAGADSVASSNDYHQYRLASAYAVISYHRKNRYLLECTGRIDGSSRFGPDKQYAAFGSVAAGWIFSNERFIQQRFRPLSFGKLRVSYGTSGNDQIGDYQYFDTWVNTAVPYQSPGIRPTRLFNGDLQWEQQRNIDIGLDLGFLHNRLLFDIVWNQSRTGNQLVAYTLPSQTGFNSVLRNIDALVQNRNIESEINIKIVDKTFFKWSSSVNLSIQRNKLLKFPGLDSSAYHFNYAIGKPLNLVLRYRSTGVNPATGIYEVLDHDGNSGTTLDQNTDQVPVGTFNPKYFGGWQNSIQFHNWQLDFLFQFINQKGQDYYYALQSLAPGISFTNWPVAFLNRWRQPGDVQPYQRYTQDPNSDAYVAANYEGNSEATFTRASFIRLKNISLSYYLPEKWMRRMKINSCRVYLQSQNLLTITKFKATDPENASIYPQSVPPLRMITFGIQASL